MFLLLAYFIFLTKILCSEQWQQRTPVPDLIVTNVAAWIEGSKLA